MTTLEQQAYEAAWDVSTLTGWLTEEHAQIFIEHFMEGYLAAAEPREREIEAMKEACRKWEWSAAESLSVALACEGKIATQTTEIEALRAKVAALKETLREIAKGEGRFDTDHHQHAYNTITDMIALAVSALEPSPPSPEREEDQVVGEDN